MTDRVRVRFLLAVLCALLAWFVWAEQREAVAEFAAIRQAHSRSAREGAATARERGRRDLLGRVVQQLARRAPPPRNAAAVRDGLLRAAEDQGLDLSSARLQPLVRPPAGTAGTEARVTLLGDPVALSGFLARIEGEGWPLRTDRATLAVRGGLGTLTATILVLWPDSADSFTEADAVRLAADDRMERLLGWLEPRSRPEAVASVPNDEPAPVPRAGLAPEPATDPPPEAPVVPAASRTEAPELHGFVNVGPEAPVRAALYFQGETTLVAVGDRLGDYTVVGLEPSEAVVLVDPEGSSIRLILR